MKPDSHRWKEVSGKHVEDNPRLLANRKATKLRSLLQRQRAFSNAQVPWTEALVFLSRAGLECRLQGPARQGVHLREDIIGAITTGGEAYGCRPDLAIAKVLVRAMEEAGIRPSRRKTRFGDYEPSRLIFEGKAWLDFEAQNVNLEKVRRRLRIYNVAATADHGLRSTINRAAEREFQNLQGLEHAGILKALDYKEDRRGPALVFEHDPEAVHLDHFLAEAGARLTLDQRLGHLRSIAEALHYARGEGLFHRALSPQSILVSGRDRPLPQVRILSWRMASTLAGITATQHVERLVEDATTAYMNPEAFTSTDDDGTAQDVSGLGAIAWHLFAGCPPAADHIHLCEAVCEGQGLLLTAALEGADEELRHLIQFATHLDVSTPAASVTDFLTDLETYEERLTAADAILRF